MAFQGCGGVHRPADGFVSSPPGSTPRPVPCRSPGSGILHPAAMALPLHGAYGAPPVLRRPSTRGFSPRPPVSVPTAPSVAAEALRKLLVQRNALAPAAAAAASTATSPSSPAPAGSAFSAPAPPSPAGLRDVSDKVPFVSEAALPPPGAAGPSALNLAPAFLSRPARRGVGTVCVVSTSHDDVYCVVRPDKTAEDKFSQELDNNVCHELVTTVATHASPPPMVNVLFCDFHIRVAAIGVTVLDLVKLALRKHRIRIPLQDVYLMLDFKIIDGSVMINSIPNLKESTICVVPRLRGGVPQPFNQPVMYFQLDVIVNNNSDKFFFELEIPESMAHPDWWHQRAVTWPHEPIVTFLAELPQFVIHQIFQLVCLEGHLQDRCYFGKFDMSKVLVSSCGHVRFTSDVRRELYTKEGGEADYNRLFFMVLVFVDFRRSRYPTHVKELLKLLRNAHEDLRQKAESVAFLINHPALLTFSEKQMLYTVVDDFLFSLLTTTPTDVKKQAEVDELVKWLGTTLGNAWEEDVKKIPDFNATYMYGAQIPQGSSNGLPKQSVYRKGADQRFRLSRNVLRHKFVWAGLQLSEAAVSYLFPDILPLILFQLERCLSGQNGAIFISLVSNPRASRTTMTPSWDVVAALANDA